MVARLIVLSLLCASPAWAVSLKDLVARISAESVPVAITAPTNGMIAYYQFEGNANDSLGNYNGTNNNAATFSNSPAISGSALQLVRASKQYIASGSMLVGSNTLSVSAWIYPLKNGTNVPSYIGVVSFDPATGYRPRISVDTGKTNWYASTGHGTTLITASFGVLPLNQWTHIAATWSNRTVTAYTNGVEANAATGASDANTIGSVTPVIGRYYTQTDNHYYDGAIDSVRIYNRALPSSEVLQIYNAEKP